jgi:uncharacterized protein
MQFLLVACDGTDSGALERRMKVREEHFKRIIAMKEAGEFLLGGAILDESGKMTGSMIVYEFPDLESLKSSLMDEPYVTGGVWVKTEIKPFRLAKFE